MDYVDLGPAMAESALRDDAEMTKLHIIALCKKIEQLECVVYGAPRPHIQPKKFGYLATWNDLFKGKEPDPEMEAEYERRRQEFMKSITPHVGYWPWGTR